MTHGSLETTWRHVCSLLSAAAATESSDAQLLARFVAERDDAAFAELVRRHGAMVLGVCRRVLRNPHDADDAFQATFLILSHKAASIRKGDCLASWLHGVALHTAISLKRNILRRKEQELPANTPQAERDDVSWREVQRLLDKELARLPEQFRQPLILCYLEGKTRDEAAYQLGWSLSTFRGRLERGRERLRGRLERRGVALSAALLATLAAKNSEAAAFSTSAASAQAAALATEVMRTMLLSKLKTAALWCVAVLLLSVGVGATAYHHVAVDAAPPPEALGPPMPPKPAPPEEDGLVKDYQAHLDTFQWSFTLKPQEAKGKFNAQYELRNIQLHVGNALFEPHAIGPTGKPISGNARITKEQAAKIVAVLAKDNFFRASVADAERLTPPKGSHAEMWASYRKDSAPQPVQRWRTLEWNLHMVRQLEAVRACVDGEAAKQLDQMLQSLEDERKQWEKTELLSVQRVDDLDQLLVIKGGIAVAKDQIARPVALNGVLPFKAWPKELTDEQRQLRNGGLKLAQQWLDQQTIEYHSTRAPIFGEAVRYTNGLTKVAQEWKGDLPAERYAHEGFHINMLLIQEGYSPFVHQPQSAWDKKTFACYESAEQYAAQHKKGIWKDAAFAARLKTIAEKWDGWPDALTIADWLEELLAELPRHGLSEEDMTPIAHWVEKLLARLPSSSEAAQLRNALANVYRELANEQDRLLNDASVDKDQRTRNHVTEVRDHSRRRAVEEFEALVALVEKPEAAEYLDATSERNVYYCAGYTYFQMRQYEKSLAAFKRMAERYKGESGYWTAVAGMASAYRGLNDDKKVRQGLEVIRNGLPDMDAETRAAMENYIGDVEKSLAGPRK